MANDDCTVVVSWPKDRARYRRVLAELPVVRGLRTVVAWALVVSAILVVLALWGGAGSDGVTLSLVPGALGLTVYLCLRRTLLGEISTGTLTWRFGANELRIEGDMASEVPWSQFVRWRCGAGHLIIEVRRPNGKQPHLAVAAPLEAFSPPVWERTQAILRDRIGAPTAG